jgi:hypothetical protein
MTSHRSFVTFNADLPDDSVFTNGGDIEVPGGRNVSELLAERLRLHGWSVRDPVQRDYYGWEFSGEVDGIETWMLLQSGEEWLLIIEGRRNRFFWFPKAIEPSEQSLKCIDEILKSCSHFEGISWHSKQDYDAGRQGGSSCPF